MDINNSKLGKRITIVGRVISLDDDANAAIIEDHERVMCHIKLPPRSSSVDIVKNQVYIFYGVVAPFQESSEDHCLEVTRFSFVKEVDLKLYGSSAMLRWQIIREMDDVAGSTVDEILTQLDQESEVSGDWNDGVQRLIGNELQGDTRETRQMKDRSTLDPGIFTCSSDPDNPNVKRKVSVEALATDIARRVYEADSARIRGAEARCSARPP